MVSPSIKTMLGIDPEELIGKKTTEFYSNPKSRTVLLDALYKKGYVENFETKLIHKEGRIVEVSADIKFLYNDKNEPVGLCGMVKDITELKRIEQTARHYLRAIEQSNEIIVITDKEGVIKFANNKTESVTGYSIHELMGQTPRLFKSGILSNNFYKKVWDDLLSGKIVENIFPNRTKSGRMYYEEKVITPIRGEDGEINLFISTGRDITDKIKARRRIELLNHNSRLKEAESNKDIILSFIHGQEEERKRVSTEIHDGLCQILSIAKMSLNSKTSANRKSSASSDLNELIESSIIEAKRIANNLSPAVLSDFGLAAGLKKLIHLNSANTRIKIHARVPETILRLSNTCELALFRIAQEAIANSIKHSGCTTIIVRLYFTSNSIILNIIDNGKGLKKNKDNRHYYGLGMGNMSQRSKIIGAELKVNSKANKYTSIHIKLNLTTSL